MDPVSGFRIRSMRTNDSAALFSGCQKFIVWNNASYTCLHPFYFSYNVANGGSWVFWIYFYQNRKTGTIRSCTKRHHNVYLWGGNGVFGMVIIVVVVAAAFQDTSYMN